MQQNRETVDNARHALGRLYEDAVDTIGGNKAKAEQWVLDRANELSDGNIATRGVKRFTNHVLDPNAPFRKISLQYGLGDFFLTLTDRLLHRNDNKDKPKDTRNIFQKTRDFWIGENNIFRRTKDFFIGENNIIHRIRYGDGEGFKAISGVLGMANAALWFFSGSDTNHEAISRLDKALGDIAAGEDKTIGLEDFEKAVQKAEVPGAVRALRRHGEWTGNAMFTLSNVSMMISGFKNKTPFDFFNGFGNVIAYGAKAIKGLEKIVRGENHWFGDPLDAPRREGMDIRIFGDALKYHTEETQSNLGAFTTTLGGATGMQYAMQGQIGAAVSQTGTTLSYYMGDFDLRYTDKQKKWTWVKENGDLLREFLGWSDQQVQEAQNFVKKHGKLPLPEMTAGFCGVVDGTRAFHPETMTQASQLAWLDQHADSLKAKLGWKDEHVQGIRQDIEGGTFPAEKIALAARDAITRQALFNGTVDAMQKHHVASDEKIFDLAAGYLARYDMVDGMDAAAIKGALQAAMTTRCATPPSQ